jgi:hypothetical protein
MATRRLTSIDANVLRGGCITAWDKALLPLGALSSLQNMRNTHPGFKQRPGQRKQHATADGTNKVLSLYQFRKTKVAERRLFAQMSDGDILEASTAPPGVGTGTFGSEIFDGASGQIPASWGILDDLMLLSNGANQHQVFGGSGSAVERFIVFRGSAAIPDIPQGGEDYSEQVSDGSDSNVAILDSLGAYADHDCIFFKTPVPCKSISLTISSVNGNAATASVHYWKSDSTWAAVSGLCDSTASGGAALAQTGEISWTEPTDLQEKYAFGTCGFWYQIRFSATLDSSVRVSRATWASSFLAIRNIWDGVAVYAVEVQVEGTSQYSVYAAGAVDLDGLAAGKKVYVGFTDPVEGIYVDPGGTPLTAGNSIASLKYWDGSAWTSVGTPTDGSNGMANAGWITFPRKSTQPLQLNTSVYHAYWYEITWSSAIDADTVVSLQGMPYFDVNELGLAGYAHCVWKDRACFVFDRFGAYIYISAKNAPMVLNGSDFGILKAGDGRANRIVAMRRFYNELIVYQEELGVEGGCITLFEGYSPATFGKIVLSSKIGSMNAKSVAVVDGVLTATATDETIKTLCFSLSRYGVAVTDGRTVSLISDDIQNYFDPTKPECIRYGYEREMWLEHDPACNVLRLGLVSGAIATVPNVFPVFDLVTKTWSFDTPAQELACMVNVEAASGQNPVLQLGGGVDDGTVYQLNYGVNDVSSPVDASFEVVLGHKGMVLELAEVMVRVAAKTAGSALLTVKKNEEHAFSKSLSLVPEKAMHTSRRHRFTCSQTSDLLTLKVSNSSLDEDLEAYGLGMDLRVWEPK